MDLFSDYGGFIRCLPYLYRSKEKGITIDTDLKIIMLTSERPEDFPPFESLIHNLNGQMLSPKEFRYNNIPHIPLCDTSILMNYRFGQSFEEMFIGDDPKRRIVITKPDMTNCLRVSIDAETKEKCDQITEVIIEKIEGQMIPRNNSQPYFGHYINDLHINNGYVLVENVYYIADNIKRAVVESF